MGTCMRVLSPASLDLRMSVENPSPASNPMVNLESPKRLHLPILSGKSSLGGRGGLFTAEEPHEMEPTSDESKIQPGKLIPSTTGVLKVNASYSPVEGTKDQRCCWRVET